jgi:translation elongation factor EF-G
METNKMKKALAGLDEEDPWLKNKNKVAESSTTIEEVTELEMHAQ